MREAAYVLDGLLNNETDLNPQEHFTDEDGYTENVFALASLLGFRFCPRFKDLAEQKIYKLNKEQVYPSIEPLFREKKTNRVFVINTSLIIEQWDNIVRLVASLKNRIVSASLLVKWVHIVEQVGYYGLLLKSVESLKHYSYLNIWTILP